MDGSRQQSMRSGGTPSSSSSSIWKSLALVILLGATVLLVVFVALTIIARDSPCKDSSTCPIYQTCDDRRGVCVSLPGYKCSTSSQCSILAPVCQSNGGYCTNIASQDRGTAGNPPREAARGGAATCDPGLTLNQAANLCQQISIGAQCTIDAQCNVGICDSQTHTCRYATTRCTTDTILNPSQCAPPYQCDYSSLKCTIPGSTPGGDGTPCNTNLDCANGSACIFGPPGAGYSGVCRSGHATWLMILGGREGGISSPTPPSCMTPLVGGGTPWCRYDIASFMQCDNLTACQYPYPTCDTQLSLCVKGAVQDPIDLALAAGLFAYDPVGINAPSTTVKGAFFIADYPLASPTVENPTGGKLIDPYTGFLTYPSQFASQPGFQGRPLVSFSRYTSFCVASLALLTTPPSPPQTAYHTAILEDPMPVLVMSSIIPRSDKPQFSELWISFYSQNLSIPNFPQPMNNVLGGGGNSLFDSSDARMWNPAAIAALEPNLAPVAFVQNPIVTPWIGVSSSGNAAPSPQTMLIHSLISAGNTYIIGVFSANIGTGSDSKKATAIYPVQQPAVAGVPPSLLSPDKFLVTSWDALSALSPPNPAINTTILLYGLNREEGQYELYVVQVGFVGSGTNLVIQSPPPLPGFPASLPSVRAVLPFNIVSPITHCRLSRTLYQTAEPLLSVTVLSEAASGLRLDIYSVASIGDTFDLESNQCAGSQTLDGVTSIFFVTSATGAYNYGSFVVWCSTAQTRLTFLTIQVNAICNPTSPQPFAMAQIYSAIYWRRLTGETSPTDNLYHLYPVGGASLPYLLATDIPLTFDGEPVL